MRSVDSWLDRFARKHPRLGIPRLMLYLVIGNVLVYFFGLFSQGPFSKMLCFSRDAILSGQLWRLVTFIFVPSYSGIGNLFFFAISLFFYYSIGNQLEREWGATKFTLYYLAGVLFNILVGFLVGYTTMDYVNLSLFFAFATLYPEARVILIIFPVKIKWLAWVDAAIYAVMEVLYLVQGQYLSMLIPVAALLNYFLFFWSFLADWCHRKFGRVKHAAQRQTIDFKAAQKKAKETRGYLHKCAVCGVTDADDPNMEFRYCSKCDGYYCYCMDHINSHVHVKE